MKIRTRKFRVNLLNKKNKFFSVILFCFILSFGHSQSIDYLGNGKYEFDTNFYSSDLHFYLFDDGYHSFQKNSIHYYLNTSIPASPRLFHKEPYSTGDIDEFIFPNVDEGILFIQPENLPLDNQIEVKRSWNMVDGMENFFLLMFENARSTESISGCVEFHYNKNDITILEEEILDNYNDYWVENREIYDSEYEGFTHKFKWEFNNLMPQEQRFVYLPAKCSREVFSVINTRGVLKIDDCDIFIPDNSKLDGSNEDIVDGTIYTLESIVSNYPHDPNYIVTNPDCLEPAWGIPTIDYKVIFQNDGKDPVQNVYIEIETNGEFSFDNVRLANSSDYCELSWGENFININFPDIFLPGMGAIPEPLSFDETIGWVELKLCFNLFDYSQDDIGCMNSDGLITFDNQPPVSISNSLCTSNICESNIDLIGKDCPISDFHQSGSGAKTVAVSNLINELDFEIIPNISRTNINVKGFEENEELECTIINASKGLVKKVILKESKFIDISDLPDGMYFLKINSHTNSQTKRFVKI